MFFFKFILFIRWNTGNMLHINWFVRWSFLSSQHQGGTSAAEQNADHPEARGHTCVRCNKISYTILQNKLLLMQRREARPLEKLLFWFFFRVTLKRKTVTWHKSSHKANIVQRYFPQFSDARCWMLYEMPPLYFSRWQRHSLLYGERV